MKRFIKKAHEQAFSLMVSLPRNRADFAKAAEAGGADAIKVHLNVKHPASGHLFGNLKTERKNIQSVLGAVSLPVGVVPGAAKTATCEDLLQLKAMGIDFFDIFAHDMPLDYLNVDLGRMICIDSRYAPADVQHLAGFAELFECSIIPHEGYGKPVTVADLISWKDLTENLPVPLLVSTQRNIKPEECRELARVGVRGVVIGVVATGETVRGVEEVTRAFKNAIDRQNA